MKLPLSTIWLFGALLVPVQAADKPALNSRKEKTSYSLGWTVGNAWKNRDVEPLDLDLDTVLKGIRDALTGGESLLTEPEVRESMMAFQTDLRNKVQEKRKRLGAKNQQEGEAFLAQNKNKPGVTTLPDGLQYKVLKEGAGPAPKLDETVSVNYRGAFIDGREFDRSKEGHPTTFAVANVIKGWQEALQKMKAGSKWQLFVPSDLAYGERGYGGRIGPNAALVFEMELVSISSPPPTPPVAPVTSDIIKVPSQEELKRGAKIEIIKPDQLPRKKP